jgi:hypothetical protein
MKFCPSCGGELRPGARFCISCGTPIIVEQEQAYTPQPPQPPQPPQQSVPYQPQQPAQPQYDSGYQQQGYQQGGSNQNYTQPNYGNAASEAGLVSRAMSMITKPKTEWLNVLNETPLTSKQLTYAVTLMLIPAICNFIAYAFIGVKMMGYTFKSVPSGVQQGLMSFIGGFLSVYLTALVVDVLATSFDSEKNFGRSLQLVVYSMTPFWVGGIFFLIPGFTPLVMLIGIYALYVMYKGIPVIKRTPEHKAAGYFIVTIIALIVVQVVIALILGIILGGFFASKMGAF